MHQMVVWWDGRMVGMVPNWFNAEGGPQAGKGCYPVHACDRNCQRSHIGDSLCCITEPTSPSLTASPYYLPVFIILAFNIYLIFNILF